MSAIEQAATSAPYSDRELDQTTKKPRIKKIPGLPAIANSIVDVR
jgi:hypothetical protein